MFKVGEIVACIDTGNSNFLLKGCSYEISHVGIDLVQVKHSTGLYSKTLFKSIKTPLLKIAPKLESKSIMTLPTNSKDRKDYPLLSGCVRYFPAALAGVSLISKKGNDKHNPGEELHHARGKSMDHGDCILRHLIDVQDLLALYSTGTQSEHMCADINLEKSILEEVNQLSWRVLAYSQELHEKFGAPLAPGAKL